ncbi:MAG TPA: YciI family protein [Lichenihabitans sp.]|nr:YciI family protein [Lichenihabitans sp.]
MKYILMIYRDEAAFQAMEPTNTHSPAYMAYGQALQQAGALVDGRRLRPADTASTVRSKDGKVEVLDGPYSDTREQLGGYFLIDAPDLDAAIAWAARCPGAAQGAVEVRPLWEM